MTISFAQPVSPLPLLPGECDAATRVRVDAASATLPLLVRFAR